MTTVYDCAVVTGSRAYGTPRPDSDLDLVVLLAPDDVARVVEALEIEVPEDKAGQFYPTLQVKLGKLNLIMETDVDRFHVWRKGTRVLKGMAPVTREQAVDTFKAMRRELEEVDNFTFNEEIRRGETA